MNNNRKQQLPHPNWMNQICVDIGDMDTTSKLSQEGRGMRAGIDHKDKEHKREKVESPELSRDMRN